MEFLKNRKNVLEGPWNALEFSVQETVWTLKLWNDTSDMCMLYFECETLRDCSAKGQMIDDELSNFR